MADSLVVSRGQAANFLIGRSFLVERGRSVEAVVRGLSCIQVDPINVVGRSHELALWNRVRAFRVPQLRRALYERRTLFEYWMQLFSILPIESYPYLSIRMDVNEGWLAEKRERHAHLLEDALAFVAERGALGSRELTSVENGRREGVWAASHRSEVLEALWDSGHLIIAGRQNNQRLYDLAERVLPAELAWRASHDESRRFFLRQHFRYVGLARASFLNRAGYVSALGLREELSRWAASAEAVPVTVEGSRRTWYVHAEEADVLAGQPEAPQHRGLNLLPPLDPLIIDRELLSAVWGFDYTWEAYVPAAKRRFGYYGLPVLYEGSFVGQVDARFRRAEDRVEVLGSVLDRRGIRFERALARTLEEMARFLSRR